MKNKSLNIAMLVVCFFCGSSYAQKICTLDECVRMALINNVKIKNAQLNIEQAKQQKKEAFTKYLPMVSASGMVFKANDYLVDKTVSVNSDQQAQLAQMMAQMGLNPQVLSAMPTSYAIEALNHGMVANMMAVQPIFVGGRIVNGNKLAKLQIDVRELQLRQSQNEVENTTVTYYNQLLSLYQKQHTLDVVDSLLSNIRRDAANAYEAGVANKNDVLSVELKQNEVEANRLKLGNGINVCRMLLAQYVGLDERELVVDTTLLADLPDPKIYRVDHESALSNKVESRLLDENVKANELQTNVKRGALMPTISVGAVGAYQDLEGDGQFNMIGFASVSVPISDLWSNNHELMCQKVSERIARNDREDNRKLLLIQMQSAYDNLENAYKQIELAKKSKASSSENLRLNEDYYQAGTTTMSDLLNAQSSYQQSLDQYTDAVVQYMNSRTAYLIVVGK